MFVTLALAKTSPCFPLIPPHSTSRRRATTLVFSFPQHEDSSSNSSNCFARCIQRPCCEPQACRHQQTTADDRLPLLRRFPGPTYPRRSSSHWYWCNSCPCCYWNRNPTSREHYFRHAHEGHTSSYCHLRSRSVCPRFRRPSSPYVMYAMVYVRILFPSKLFSYSCLQPC